MRGFCFNFGAARPPPARPRQEAPSPLTAAGGGLAARPSKPSGASPRAFASEGEVWTRPPATEPRSAMPAPPPALPMARESAIRRPRAFPFIAGAAAAPAPPGRSDAGRPPGALGRKRPRGAWDGDPAAERPREKATAPSPTFEPEARTTRWTLRRRDPAEVERLSTFVERAAERTVPRGTQSQNRAGWKYWCRFCSEVFDTSPERTNRDAHEGLDREAQQDEELLIGTFLVWLVSQVPPRSKKDAQAKPSSLYAHVLAVRRVHRQRWGVTMVKPLNLSLTLRAVLTDFVRDHGPEALLPRRKEPASGAMLLKLLAVPQGVRLGRWTLEWGSVLGVSLRAMLCTAFSGGFRKAELALPAGAEFDDFCIKRASLSWRIAGVIVAAPSRAQLEGLCRGDFALITPPPSKADHFGTFFGNRPVWLPFVDTPGNAAAALAQLELRIPVAAAERRSSPLFMEAPRTPLGAGRADRLLKHLLHQIMSKSEASRYSWHSFRIGLACALLAKGARPELIQALCRWKSPESLVIYARLNAEAYGDWVLSALSARISSVQTANLPPIDDADCAALLTEVAGELE